MIVFKRKIYKEFLNWKKESKGSDALLIEGARRIGKSTIVEEFAKKEYKSYILLDFNDCSEQVKDAFNTKLINLDDFFSILSYTYNINLYPRKTLIIFDEVQQFPKARQSIKKLVKDGRFDYIETGSLISINENVKDITIPSEEKSIKMFPLDFEEFAWAMEKNNICDYIRECFKKQIPLEPSIHKEAMFLFKQYMLIGGMPQSILDYIEHSFSFEYCDRRKRMINDLYRKDIQKIKFIYRKKVEAVFNQIPSYLSKHEKRIVFSKVAGGINTEDSYENTFLWLSDSMIANCCYKCNDPSVGLSMNIDDSAIKCYMADTGLLFSLAFDENKIADEQLYKQIMNDKLSINKGMLYENIIAQMLSANCHKLFFYTHFNKEKHRNDLEIDFLLSESSSVDSKIIPIEVKSSKNYTKSSLDDFIVKYKDKIKSAYIIHPKNLLKKENGIIAIPPYMTICL